MSKILVSGGAGFIGSNLVDSLIALGHQVVVLDNLFSGRKDYINPQARFYQVDIANQKEVAEIFSAENFSYVYHLAAQIDVRRSVDDPAFDNQVNVLGGLNILSNCLKYKVKKIFFTSSGGAIYGRPDKIPTAEDYPAYPLSPYGVSKLSFEKYLSYYHRVFGQEYIAFRLANVYGPRQYRGGEAGVVSIFIDNAVNDRTSHIFGDGFQTRDYVFVSDVVSALLSGLDSEAIGEFNIGTGLEKNLLDIILAIEAAQGKKMKLEYLPAKPGEERFSCLDCSRAKKVLNWSPRVELTEGIKLTLAWSEKQKN